MDGKAWPPVNLAVSHRVLCYVHLNTYWVLNKYPVTPFENCFRMWATANLIEHHIRVLVSKAVIRAEQALFH